jgi:hypothetical protein
MSQAVADSVSGLPRIVVNNAYTLAPNAEILYACDSKWWLSYPDALGFDGLKVTIDASLDVPQVMLLKNTGTHGYDPDPANLRTGHNSGYQAVQLAVKMGAAKILLLGFDMHGAHFFGDHPDHLQDRDPDLFSRFIAEFDAVAPTYAEMGVDVVNCTAGSALKCFRMSTVDVELGRATEDAPVVEVAPPVEPAMDRLTRILRL